MIKNFKQKYSIFSLARNSLSYHKNWNKAWRSPYPQKNYDIIIVGGGGHGLATAYYLASVHKLNNIAVIEKIEYFCLKFLITMNFIFSKFDSDF